MRKHRRKKFSFGEFLTEIIGGIIEIVFESVSDAVF